MIDVLIFLCRQTGRLILNRQFETHISFNRNGDIYEEKNVDDYSRSINDYSSVCWRSRCTGATGFAP